MIYVQRASKTPLASPTGGEYPFGNLTAGETLTFPLRFVKEGANGAMITEDPDIRFLQASVGLVDARAEGGTLAYQIGSGPTTAANTTMELRYNHTALALQNAINVLVEIVDLYGMCKVVEVPNGFTIYWPLATGAIQIRARRNRVWPISVVRVMAYEQNDEEWVHEIRLVQAQLSSTSNYVRVLPPPPRIEAVRDGATDPSGTYKQTEIQRLVLPPEFRGTYQIRRSDTGMRTAMLSLADGPEQVRETTGAMYKSEGGIINVTPGEGYGEIEFAGELAGLDMPLLEIVIGTAPAGDPTVTLNLKQPAVYQALRSQASVTVYIELKARIADHGATVEDPGKPEVLFRREVQLVRDQNFDEMLTLMEARWLRAPNPVDYVPYKDDQVQVGNAYWHGPVGDGVKTSITIQHNVGSDAVASLVLRQNINAGTVLQAGLDFEWTPGDANSIELTFPTAPAPNSLYLVVMFAIPVSALLIHTHTMEQVVGLIDLRDELLTRIVTLESVLPSTGPSSSASQGKGRVTMLPMIKEVLFFKGSLEGVFTDKGIDASKLPRPPVMLPACHDATVTSAETKPNYKTNAGEVFTNAMAKPLVLGSGYYGGTVKVGDNFASDGRCLYAVRREGATNSYYPRGFEREPWRIFSDDKVLRVGRTLDVQFALATQVIGGTSTANWVFVIEHGTTPADSSPNPTGPNLQNVVWNTAAPIVIHPIKIGPLKEIHTFGVRIKRTLTGMIADALLYADWYGVNELAPASANFALRGYWKNFDTENSLASNARGWVTYQLLGVGEGEAAAQAQAVII